MPCRRTGSRCGATDVTTPDTTTPAGASRAEVPAGIGHVPTTPAAAGLRGAWDRARWWVRQLTGEGRYDAYLAHHRAHHPDVDPMTEREFWRDEYAKQDANPGSRCC